MLMSKFPYTYLLILLISPSWYQTICVGILCAVFTFLVMSVVYRLRLRKVARVIRVRSNERLIQRTLIAREFYDTLLQTVEACKFVIDDALEKSNDTAHMRRALEQLSNWLGQATQEGQKALHSLSTANVEKHDD